MAAKKNIVIVGAIAAVIAYLLYKKNSKKAVANVPETPTETGNNETAFYEEPHVIQNNNTPAVVNTGSGNVTPVNNANSQPPLAIGNVSLEPVIPIVYTPVIPQVSTPVIPIVIPEVYTPAMPPVSTPVLPQVSTPAPPLPPNVCPAAPQLFYVYLSPKREIILEWDNTNSNDFTTVTRQYSIDGINWSSTTGSSLSPANMGNEQQYLQNLIYSIKYGGKGNINSDQLYVRLIGNCKNGISTPPSNVVTYYLSNPLSYYSNSFLSKV